MALVEINVNNAPHAQAAFINVIADEGTKAEAVEWLQKTWNEHMALVKAVRAIYFAAYWHPDRPLKHEEWLWTTLRDAAGITPGESSKQLGPDQSLRPEETATTPEVRLNDDGTLDEVCGTGAHLEQMDKDHWFLEVLNGDKSVAVWLHSRSKIVATYEHRDNSRSMNSGEGG
jgi:hypothetical protein